MSNGRVLEHSAQTVQESGRPGRGRHEPVLGPREPGSVPRERLPGLLRRGHQRPQPDYDEGVRPGGPGLQGVDPVRRPGSLLGALELPRVLLAARAPEHLARHPTPPGPRLRPRHPPPLEIYYPTINIINSTSNYKRLKCSKSWFISVEPRAYTSLPSSFFSFPCVIFTPPLFRFGIFRADGPFSSNSCTMSL
jgi:hypothetical protein